MSLPAGLAAVQTTFQMPKQCMNFMHLTGPYNDLDPMDRAYIGDVRREMNDGGEKGRLNASKTLAIQEAFHRAGLRDTHIAVPKNHTSASTVAVAVGTEGTYPIMMYGNNSFDKNVPQAVSVSTAPTTGKPPGGTVLASYQNGVSLVMDTTPRVSLYEQLNANQDTIQGVSIWDVPRYNGDVANLGQAQGSTYIEGLQSGQLMQQLIGSGAAPAMSSLSFPITQTPTPSSLPFVGASSRVRF